MAPPEVERLAGAWAKASQQPLDKQEATTWLVGMWAGRGSRVAVWAGDTERTVSVLGGSWESDHPARQACKGHWRPFWARGWGREPQDVLRRLPKPARTAPSSCSVLPAPSPKNAYIIALCSL